MLPATLHAELRAFESVTQPERNGALTSLTSTTQRESALDALVYAYVPVAESATLVMPSRDVEATLATYAGLVGVLSESTVSMSPSYAATKACASSRESATWYAPRRSVLFCRLPTTTGDAGLDTSTTVSACPCWHAT